jgi:hypothetical protein
MAVLINVNQASKYYKEYFTAGEITTKLSVVVFATT